MLFSGAMSMLFVMLIASPLFGQTGMSISIFEYPEPFVFSKQKHFRKGVASRLTLLMTNGMGGGGNNNNFSQWDLSITAEGNLDSGSRSIPISSIWAKAKGSSKIRSMGKVFLSTKYQTIAKFKPGAFNSSNYFVVIKLKAFDGKHFLKQAGEYSSQIYFTLMMD